MSARLSTTEPNSNRLNVYLIKEIISDYDEATQISTDSSIRKKEIPNVGVLYYKRSATTTPRWVSRFFNDVLDPEEKSDLFIASSSALLVAKVTLKRKSRLFCIPFGSGRFIMKDGVQEERFGLRTCLNILAEDKIRSIGKRTISQNPKASIEQISKASFASDFQIDIEKDLLNSITGYCTEKDFGNVVTGKDALSVSYRIDVTNVVEFLRRCLVTYAKDSYKANFDWIDQIQEVKNKRDIDALDAKLVSSINSGSKDVWMAPPEVIDWTDFSGFKYSTKKSDDLYEELDISNFLEATGIASVNLDILKEQVITCWKSSTNEISFRWRVFNCLNAEVKLRKGVYILDSGKWYEINKDFVERVNEVYNAIPWAKSTLPHYKHKSEGDYNIAAATAVSGHCMDADNIPHGGGYSKIEFCDFITKKKELFFVKKYGGSAPLSHLFAQGYTTGELLLNDKQFRQKVVNKLPTGYKGVVPVDKIKANGYTLYYAIISKDKKKTSLPFFSRINLKNVYNILTNYGYSVRLCHIENHN